MIGDILAAWAIGVGAFLYGLLVAHERANDAWVRGYCEGRRDLHRELTRRDGRYPDPPVTDAEIVEEFLADLRRHL